jgi:hypothetical protein
LGQFEPLDEPGDPVCEHLSRICGKDARYVGAERFGGFEVPLRIGAGYKTEDRWSIQHHRISVRYHRVIARISALEIAFHHARHGIRHPMRQVHASVAESDAGVRGSQDHVGAGVVVGRIFHRSHQVSGHHTHSVE